MGEEILRGSGSGQARIKKTLVWTSTSAPGGSKRRERGGRRPASATEGRKSMGPTDLDPSWPLKLWTPLGSTAIPPALLLATITTQEEGIITSFSRKSCKRNI